MSATTMATRSSFEDLGLSSALALVVGELGFTEPTPVQAAAIPLLLDGKDLIAQARTGTGKTAAFALPILQKLDLSVRAPAALVLCPTRELSAQVAREVRRLGRRHPGLRVVVVAGGEPRRRQSSALEEGAHVVVGTPGRMADLLRRGELDLETLQTLVLDEADRMLDMGFEDEMQQILVAAPKARQTALFSATFPESIVAMSKKHQRSPARVTIETEADEPAEIRELVMRVEADQKLGALRSVLAHHPHESALVFANFKASVAQVAQALSAAGVSADALHGDLEQVDRDRVMAKFRNGSTRVLVATDVAARGIDVEGLDLIVNYELPSKGDVYVHRIGRTGRAGRSGVAISFAAPEDRRKVETIEAFIGARLRPASPTPERGAAEPAKGHDVATMDTLRLSLGRRDKIRPGDILGALTGEAGGLAGTDVGKIEIHETFSYVAIARKVSRAAVDSLSAGRIKGKRCRVVLER